MDLENVILLSESLILGEEGRYVRVESPVPSQSKFLVWKSYKVTLSQLVKIQAALIVLFWRRYLNIRVVCCQILGPKSIANRAPLTKLVLTRRIYVSLVISLSSLHV